LYILFNPFTANILVVRLCLLAAAIATRTGWKAACFRNCVG